MNPKIFVCHATDDKKRFVENFTTELRSNGIDAWVSFWDINDGDSIIEKIFNEGIKNSSHFIIVLSKRSVKKKWVNKELHVAVAKQLESNYTIIPVIIDDIEIPNCIKDIKYCKINDLDNFNTEVTEIIKSILGLYSKPPLGELPIYTNEPLFMADLVSIDNIILDICFNILEKTHLDYLVLSFNEVISSAEERGIGLDDVIDSLVVLRDKYYLTGTSARYKRKEMVLNPKFTTYGFNQIALHKIKDYSTMLKNIAILIYNEFSSNDYVELNSSVLAPKVKLPQNYVYYMLKYLSEQNCIKISETIMCIHVNNILPNLKRYVNT